MKSREQLISRLRHVGIEPDLRQQGRDIVFAVFSIADGEMGDELGKAGLSLKDYFISEFNASNWGSKLRQITFSPTMVSFGPKLPVLKLSHKRTECAVVVQASIDENKWKRANSKARHALLLAPLLSSLPEIKSDWLHTADRDLLQLIFQKYRS
jgi:hypothetical protein